jgi:hypothetical protein
MKLNKFLIIALLVNGSFAQQNTTAKIEIVKESGLHKIILPAEIRSFSKEDLSDFRILDSKSKQVPYFTIQENQTISSSNFIEFKPVSKTTVSNKSSSYVFENPIKNLNKMVLRIGNSNAVKTFSISGSYDQKEWFGLINNSLLYNLESTENTSIFKTLTLPISSYPYLKIEFNDKKTLPINLLKAGYTVHSVQNAALQEIVPKSTLATEIESQKKTRIHVIFDNRQIVNQLIFQITNPDLYKRMARIYVIKSHQLKHKTEIYQETVCEFELNSDSKNEINIPQLFEKEFFIEIENQDNQPLTLAKIQFFQNQVSVIADLKANEKYTIKTGNPNLNAPDYDLENFKNKMTKTLPEAKIYQIEHPNYNNSKAKNNSIWQQPWFMWICIGMGGMAVLYFTINLIKDMNNKS